MIHYTLNTGHSRESHHREVPAKVLQLMQPMIMVGRSRLPKPLNDYAVQTTVEGGAVLATIYDISRPVITIGVCTDEESSEPLWEQLERLYYQVSDMPGFRTFDWAATREPEAVPWCADLVCCMRDDEARWTGDFARCIAWGWINKLTN